MLHAKQYFNDVQPHRYTILGCLHCEIIRHGCFALHAQGQMHVHQLLTTTMLFSGPLHTDLDPTAFQSSLGYFQTLTEDIGSERFTAVIKRTPASKDYPTTHQRETSRRGGSSRGASRGPSRGPSRPAGGGAPRSRRCRGTNAPPRAGGRSSARAAAGGSAALAPPGFHLSSSAAAGRSGAAGAAAAGAGACSAAGAPPRLEGGK